MESTRISTQVSVKHCSLCQGDTEYYCYGCRQDLCIQCKKLHVIDVSSKNHEVTRYIESLKYPPKDESEGSRNPDCRDSSKPIKSARFGNSEQVMCVRSRDPVPLPVWLSPSERSGIHEIEGRLFFKRISYLRGSISYNMKATRISNQVSVKHCSLCQGDTEYYCYRCRQDLCIQCKKLHVIDLSSKNHEVTLYIESLKYPLKVESEEFRNPDGRDSSSSKPIKSARFGNSEQVISVRFRDPVPLPFRLSPSERSEIERRLYSERISYLRGETLYNRRVMLEGVRQDLITGHKAVTIRGLSIAKMIDQVPKDKIDEVLAGDLEDRYIIQKTRMTRHMTRLLHYVYRYEQLYDIMVKKPIKFLQIMTRNHDSLKTQEKLLTRRGKKELINIMVNLMKGMRLVETGKRQAPGTELLLTLMSSPVLKKSLSVTNFKNCSHTSCVAPDRVWVSDSSNLILTDTETGKQLHSLKHPLLSGTGKHTVNCGSELIYIDKDRNINKLYSDMEKTTTLIKHTDETWEPTCVYCSQSSGDLLVGMYREDKLTGKVMRYDNTGKHKQTIPHNDNTPQTLYELPHYITENNNGDVLVSDRFCSAVVVTSGEGVHRFSYTGPPSSKSGLFPQGICTDVMSHILVSDDNTHTVQMLDRDGRFLSYLLTSQSPGINVKPFGLSYDVTNHVLLVGSYNQTLSVYRYINRHLALSDTREHCDVSLSSEPFNSRHIPGLTQKEFDRQKEEERRRKQEEARRRLQEAIMEEDRRRQEEEEDRRRQEEEDRRRQEEEEDRRRQTEEDYTWK